MTQQECYMMEALELAREAAAEGEVPVGCVIVQDGRIIGRGRNRREEKQSTASHAEMEAIAQANAALGTWRLDTCELYVTLEPCPMCAGAILNARLDEVCFGAPDPKAGCFGSLCDLNALPFNHHPLIAGGVLQEECAQILKDYFRQKRKSKKE